MIKLYYKFIILYTCRTTCGDGVISNSVEQWDDGNVISGDGWSSSCNVEQGFSWTTNVLSNPQSSWSDVWGNGVRISSSGCDDGNNINGDGWDSNWNVELGYIWTGGTSTTPDKCTEIWGDGIPKCNFLYFYLLLSQYRNN